MALTLLSANNASTVLSAGISSSATTLTVNTGTGGLFPSPVSGTSLFKLTLIDAATGTLTEIVHVTARSGDTMTIVRGQEGTVSRLWSANDIAANMMTAGTLSLLAQKDMSLQIANNLSEIATAGPAAVTAALTNLGLTDIGIGLSTQPTIANFDFQTFAFTSGANYLTAYNTWINPPAGITYIAGSAISVTVEYVNSNRIGLTILPDTGNNFHVFKVLCVGAAGSRVFTVREEWNSANPVPISGGGTGAATVNGAIANLGLGDVANMTDVRKLIDAAFPVGVPIPYPLAAIPETAMGVVFFKLNGGTFSTTTYPKLALKYPTGVLPDMRGEFIRGWDDSRGVDTLRTLLSAQASTSIRTAAMDYSGNDAAYTNSFVGTAHADSDSATKTQPTTAKSPNNSAMTGPVSDNVMVATQNNTGLGSDSAVWITGRPRNIAFNYIVRAA